MSLLASRLVRRSQWLSGGAGGVGVWVVGGGGGWGGDVEFCSRLGCARGLPLRPGLVRRCFKLEANFFFVYFVAQS